MNSELKVNEKIKDNDLNENTKRSEFIKGYLAQLDIQDSILKIIKKELKERKDNIRARKDELRVVLKELKET